MDMDKFHSDDFDNDRYFYSLIVILSQPCTIKHVCEMVFLFKCFVLHITDVNWFHDALGSSVLPPSISTASVFQADHIHQPRIVSKNEIKCHIMVMDTVKLELLFIFDTCWLI